MITRSQIIHYDAPLRSQASFSFAYAFPTLEPLDQRTNKAKRKRVVEQGVVTGWLLHMLHTGEDIIEWIIQVVTNSMLYPALPFINSNLIIRSARLATFSLVLVLV
jgi:hypothetical protein